MTLQRLRRNVGPIGPLPTCPAPPQFNFWQCCAEGEMNTVSVYLLRHSRDNWSVAALEHAISMFSVSFYDEYTNKHWQQVYI